MAHRGELKWENIDRLKESIDNYFKQCEADQAAPNIAGLCVALDISTETFRYYANGRYEERLAIKAREQKQELLESAGEEELQALTEENGILQQYSLPYQRTNEIDRLKSDVSVCLKSAKTRMENWWWKNGADSKNPAMSIFALKAVHGYTDQPAEVHATQNNLNLNIKIEAAPKNAPIITVSED